MQKLRVVVLSDGLDGLQNWELRLFDKICSDERFELAGVVIKAGASGEGANNIARWVFDWVAWLEGRLFARLPATSGGVFRSALTDTPILRVPADGQHASKLSEEDHRKIRALRPEVLLQLATGGCWRRAHDAARFGVWALSPFADSRGGKTAGFQESLERQPTTRVMLWQRGPAVDADVPLAEARFNTDTVAARNRVSLGEKSVSLVWRALVRLAAARSEPQRLGGHIKNETCAPVSLRQTLLYAARVLCTVASAGMARAKRALGWRRNMWSLFFGTGPLTQDALQLSVECPPDAGEFWADPFFFQRDGEAYVFFENYVYASARAKISVGRYDASGFTVLGDALDLPYHLSFPYVFEWDGDLFMVPETSAARRVEVWRCVDFPHRWERYATALEGTSVADTVLFEEGGQWWMFANISEGPIEDHCNELHVFSVDGPRLTRVEPHPLNPVVIDCRTARNGGRVHRRGGRLIRPSQNNSRGVYGWGLNLMEITRLDMESYEERSISQFAPGFKPGIIGCHHADFTGDMFVVDGCRFWG